MKKRINYVHEYKRLHREKMQHKRSIEQVCDSVLTWANRSKRTVEAVTGGHLSALLDILVPACAYNTFGKEDQY